MTQYCQSCGAVLDDGARFCKECGVTVEQQAQAQPAYTPPPPTQQAAYTAPYSPPPPQPQPAQPAPSYYAAPAAAQSMLSAPMGVGQYIGTFIVAGLPLIGFIMLLVWSFGSQVNKNKQNFARAVLLLAVIGGILSALLWATLIPAMLDLFTSLEGAFV